MLLDLEAAGQEVYYSAPTFHSAEGLNAAFMTNAVGAQSIGIRPSEIGPLTDNLEHHVSFEPGSPWTFFSEPRPLKVKREFNQVNENLHLRLKERGLIDLGRGALDGLALTITQIAEKRREINVRQQAITREVLGRVAPLQRVAYYASVFLEAQLFVVQEREAI
jgi:hypothetical protein